MAIRPALPCALYTTSSEEQTGYIITLSQFEEGDLLLESCRNTESGDEYYRSDNDSTLPPIISEIKMDEISSGNESDAETTPMDMLKGIHDVSQYHPRINRREAH